MAAKYKRWSRHYPWDVWLAKRRFQLIKGRDYECRTWTMAQQVTNRANKAGLRASFSFGDTDASFWVTLKPKDQPAGNGKAGKHS